MKKNIIILLCSFSFVCINAQEKAKTKTNKKTQKIKPIKELKDCGEYNGQKLYKGAEGGCYYKDRSSKTMKINKVYIEGNFCNC